MDETVTEDGGGGRAARALGRGGGRARAATTALGGAVLAALTACLAVAGALPAVAGADVSIAAIEGKAFSGTVADVPSCTLTSADIDWGDGTPSSPGAADGDAGVQGTHVYAAPGAFGGHVVYSCAEFRFAQTAAFHAIVRDAPLNAAGVNVSATLGTPLSGVVAHFTDENPGGTAGELSAQVDWGDRTAVTAGAVTAAIGGGFDVSATHGFLLPGTYVVSTSIRDAGGSSATATSAARIAPAPPPPPPPPPPPGPQASFTFSPFHPCNNVTRLDARSSTGGVVAIGGRPPTTLAISSYRWSIDDPAKAAAGNRPLAPFAGGPFATAHFGPAYFTVVGPYEGDRTNMGSSFDYPSSLFDYRFFRPPLTVTLQVTDSAGATASTSRQITFGNPVTTVGAVVPLDRATGLPNFNPARFPYVVLFADSRSAHRCDPRSPIQKFVDQRQLTVTLLRPSLPGHTAHLASRAAIAVESQCRPTPGRCSAELVARRGRVVLGRTTFFVAGGKTATVTVKLNRRGAALARAHALHTVTLQLRSVGPRGTLVTTSHQFRLSSKEGRR